MATRNKVTSEGLQTTEIPDGVSVMPETVGTRDVADIVDEQDAESRGLSAPTDELLSALLGSHDAEHVEAVQVLVGTTLLEFGVRTLSPRESNAIVRKRMRQIGGKFSPRADSETVLRVHALVECVRKRDYSAGPEKPPRWVPCWTLEEVEGLPQKKGLIDNSSPNAQQLMGGMDSGLLCEIWARNPAICPAFLDMEERMISEGAMLKLNG